MTEDRVPYGNQTMPDEEALPAIPTAEVIQAQTKGQLEVSMEFAKRNPRKIEKFLKDSETMITASAEIAAECIYSKPVGSGTVSGASIRQMEIEMNNYGNLMVEARQIAESDTAIVVQASGMDLQTNNFVRVEVVTPIVTKDGRKFAPHVINSNVLGTISKGLRNVLGRLIPRVYTDLLYEKARARAFEGGDFNLLEARQKAVSLFGKMGLHPDRVFNAIGKTSIEEIDKDDVMKLRGFYNSIKDGDTDIEACFPRVQNGDAKDTVKHANEELKRKLDEKSKAKAKVKEDIDVPGGELEPSEPEQKPKTKAKAKADPERLSAEQIAQIKAFCADKDIPERDLAQAHGNIGYEQLQDLPAKKYDELMADLKALARN